MRVAVDMFLFSLASKCFSFCSRVFCWILVWRSTDFVRISMSLAVSEEDDVRRAFA